MESAMAGYSFHRTELLAFSLGSPSVTCCSHLSDHEEGPGPSAAHKHSPFPSSTHRLMPTVGSKRRPTLLVPSQVCILVFFVYFALTFLPIQKPVCKLKQYPRAWIKACYLTTLKQLCNALLQYHNFIPFLFPPQYIGKWWAHENSFPSTSPCLICPNSSPDRSASSPSSPVTCPCSLPPNILSPHLRCLQKANESEGSAACGPGTGGSWADQLTPAGSSLVWDAKAVARCSSL